jgi:hypothetical protein
MFWAGCTTVGKGTRIVVKAPHHVGLAEYYPNLIASSSTTDLRDRMVAIPSKTDVNPDVFRTFIWKRYGTEEFEAAELSATIRDRSAMPPFLPVDSSKVLLEKIATIYTGDEKLPEEKEHLLRSRLLNVPDLIPTTTLHHKEDGRDVYFYYPRVQIDFSSRLLTNSQLDRFDFLGMVVKIKNDETHGEYSVRFVDFSPKDADFVEFTRGQFTQQSQLQAKGTGGLAPSVSQETTTPISGIGNSTVNKVSARTTTLDGELSYTLTEGYVSELKDAIEKRTTSILNNGELFVSEFRAIREKRIGGTYTFDLMLEVPAEIKKEKTPHTYSSQPITKQIKVDIYIVGVVRHVYKRGMKGLFIKGPESENDNVYETVVGKVLEDRVLWTFQGHTWVQQDSIKSPQVKITVTTNRDDANFILKDSDGKLLGQGSGKNATIVVENPSKTPCSKTPCSKTSSKNSPSKTPPDEDTRRMTLTFLPIVAQSSEGTVLKLRAPHVEPFSVMTGAVKEFAIEGRYFD